MSAIVQQNLKHLLVEISSSIELCEIDSVRSLAKDVARRNNAPFTAI